MVVAAIRLSLSIQLGIVEQKTACHMEIAAFQWKITCLETHTAKSRISLVGNITDATSGIDFALTVIKRYGKCISQRVGEIQTDAIGTDNTANSIAIGLRPCSYSQQGQYCGDTRFDLHSISPPNGDGNQYWSTPTGN